MEKISFGTRGIWKKPANEHMESKLMMCVVLEQTKEGLLYIFTDKPIVRGFNNLSFRTATIFPSDFTREV